MARAERFLAEHRGGTLRVSAVKREQFWKPHGFSESANLGEHPDLRIGARGSYGLSPRQPVGDFCVPARNLGNRAHTRALS